MEGELHHQLDTRQLVLLLNIKIMHSLKKLAGFGAGVVLLGAALAPVAQASALSQNQVNAIIGLLQSFGADQSVINNVQSALGGGSSTDSLSCSSFSDVSYGQFDNSPGGRVSQLQTWLGIPSNTFGFGTYGKKTQAAWNVKCGGNQQQNSITFSATPTSGSASLAVTFYASGLSNATDYFYQLRFGDGQQAQTRSFSSFQHTYINPGTYTAILLDQFGNQVGSATVTVSGTVQKIPSATIDQSSLTASVSSVPNVTLTGSASQLTPGAVRDQSPQLVIVIVPATYSGSVDQRDVSAFALNQDSSAGKIGLMGPAFVTNGRWSEVFGPVPQGSYKVFVYDGWGSPSPLTTGTLTVNGSTGGDSFSVTSPTAQNVWRLNDPSGQTTETVHFSTQTVPANSAMWFTLVDTNTGASVPLGKGNGGYGVTPQIGDNSVTVTLGNTGMNSLVFNDTVPHYKLAAALFDIPYDSTHTSGCVPGDYPTYAGSNCGSTQAKGQLVATSLSPAFSIMGGTQGATPSVIVSTPSQPANTLFPQNTVNIPLTKITLTAQNGSAKIYSLAIKSAAGVGSNAANAASDTDFTQVSVRNESIGSIIGSISLFDTSHTAVVLFNNPLVLQAGVPVTLTVLGSSAANLSADAGKITLIAVTGVNSDTIVTGALPIIGATDTINTSLNVCVPNGLSIYGYQCATNVPVATTGIYYLFHNLDTGNNWTMSMQNMTQADALTQCKNTDAHNSWAVRCTWNGTEIFNDIATKTSMLTVSFDGVTNVTLPSTTLSNAINMCNASSKAGATSKKCVWAGEDITPAAVTGTYYLYHNLDTGNGWTMTNPNITQADALAQCQNTDAHNPWAVRCTWNGTEIFNDIATKTSTLAISFDGVVATTLTPTTLQNALNFCDASSKANTTTKKCVWAGEDITPAATVQVSTTQLTACTNAYANRGKNNQTFSCTCPAATAASGIWGGAISGNASYTNAYTDDSNICTAARHWKGLKLSDAFDVVYAILPGHSGYGGSTGNSGITSQSFGAYDGSFSIISTTLK